MNRPEGLSIRSIEQVTCLFLRPGSFFRMSDLEDSADLMDASDDLMGSPVPPC